jgi:hypothetical protein
MPQTNAARPKHPRTRYFVDRGLFEGLHGFADFEARIAALPAEHERGDAFEVFAEAYLATQKLVGAEEVWPADQVPMAVLQALLPSHPGHGCGWRLQDLGRSIQCLTVEVPHGPTGADVAGTVHFHGSDRSGRRACPLHKL